MPLNYILTIRIGGAHFSLCLYDAGNGRLLADSFRVIPISFKAAEQTIFNLWAAEVLAMPDDLKKSITGCAIAASGNFIDNNEDVEKRPNFSGTGLKAFFSGLLGLNVNDIRTYTNAACFLRGELAGTNNDSDQEVIGISIGTDIGAAVSSAGTLNELNWEAAPFLNGTANQYLTTRWILNRYYSLSKISLLNVQQLAGLRATNYTARAVLGEFIGNLSAFLSSGIDVKNTGNIIIGGDVVYAPGLRETLNSALSPVKITLSKQSPLSIHLGAALFYTSTKAS